MVILKLYKKNFQNTAGTGKHVNYILIIYLYIRFVWRSTQRVSHKLVIDHLQPLRLFFNDSIFIIYNLQLYYNA